MSLSNSGCNFLLSLETQGIKMGLKRTIKLLDCCNNPQNYIKSVQILGTNGKGTAAASLSRILETNGYKVGLYTSPHLIMLHERIQVNRKVIDDKHINTFISRYKNDILKINCTFFEVLTVIALHYFRDKKVDVAVLETGLGGRYDSVTASNPDFQLFTSISKDHMHILGTTIQKIAKEKAAAIRNKIPCISTSQTKVVKNILNKVAIKNNTSINYNIYNFKIEKIPLNGSHQKENILLAMTASKLFFKLNTKNILNSINKIHWPGRIQIIKNNPKIIFDVAHNDSSIIALCDFIKSHNKNSRYHLLFSIQKTKKINTSIISLKKYFYSITCTKINDKMYDAEKLSMKFNPFENLKTQCFTNNIINKMVNSLDSNDILVIAGSHYWGKYIEKTFKNSFVVNKFN